MSLIERQDQLVKKLEPIYLERLKRGTAGIGQDLVGARAKLNRLHIQEMRTVGYSQREAIDSYQQCNDVARLNAGHAHFAAQMGAA